MARGSQVVRACLDLNSPDVLSRQIAVVCGRFSVWWALVPGPNVQWRRAGTFGSALTLILAMANTKEAILVSDRRLTRNGKVVESPGGGEAESNKALALFRPDARILVGFTGLATAGSFATHKWLLEALFEVAEPGLPINGLLLRLSEKATKDIAALGLAPRARRLSIVLAGYQLDDGRPRAALWRISNCEQPLEDKDGVSRSPMEPEARRDFDVSSIVESRPTTEIPCMVFATGDDEALPEADFQALKRLLREGKSRKAIANRAVRAVRTAADNSKERLIGRKCTSLALPRDFAQPIGHAYYSEEASFLLPGPSFVEATDPNGFKLIVDDASVRAESDEGSPAPMTFEKVPRSAPCPCGSGAKFKRCHGA